MQLNRSGKTMLSRIVFSYFPIALIIGGILYAGFHAYGFAKGYLAVQSEDITFEKEEVEKSPARAGKGESAAGEGPLYTSAPETGEDMGQLVIPKLNASMSIYEGADPDTLEKGVGHYSGSVLPGMQDNSVLSGHRDTVFRNLGKVGEGNYLITKTAAGEFTYKVKNVRIVDADDRTVIVPKSDASLTLTTCYPFEYVGHAPQRYVLEAELVDKKMN